MKKLKYGMFAVLFSLLFSCGEDTQEPTGTEPKSMKVEFTASGDYEQFNGALAFTLTKGKTTLIYVEPLVSPDSLVFDYLLPGNFVNATLNFEPLTKGLTVESSEKVDFFTFALISRPRLEGDENTNYTFTGEFKVFVDNELVKTIQHTQGQNELSKTSQYSSEF